MVQLTEALVAALDREAAEAGVSRSALVRDAIEDYLDRRASDAKEARWIAGYQGIPQDTVDDWGDMADEADRRGRELAQSLDAQEAASGLTW